jgi:GNAT superfamily N-acetyltransferase
LARKLCQRLTEVRWRTKINETGEVSYRKLQRKDYPAIKTFLCDAFFRDEAACFSPRMMRLILSHYFYVYFRLHHYSLVAEYQGRTVGVVLGRFWTPFWDRRAKTPLPKALARRAAYRLMEWLLLLTAAGRRMVRINWGICRCNRLLIRGKQSHFDAELLLLLVSEDMRRKGIASELSRRFFDTCAAESAQRKAGKSKVFLFTDNYCDTAYYHNNGFTLERQRFMSIPLKPDPSGLPNTHFAGDFFLFSKEL